MCGKIMLMCSGGAAILVASKCNGHYSRWVQMTDFVYFGYGSNMLTERLKKRCSNAMPLGVGSLSDYSLNFSKRSVDGSGKATLVPSNGRNVHGVMFTVPLNERKYLDDAEGLGNGYERRDDVEILCSQTANVIVASTYIALPRNVDAALKPYDWYHTLVLAGAEEHELPELHIDSLRRAEFVLDAKLDRLSRLEAIRALNAAGYVHGFPVSN